ncbi:hypothetical protein CYLTODRAFT_413143 [Cylindrobasidium torrendii FP15055 ss-10]|uniref:Uncharacterized protein n=1 Tax=Cylindrobasidium torrendii FP15055 ss-10 TaxID=1314674 RepID=A0A0D7B3G6_9AGAR|nr:hypothetical protein CYLTODRAFT_413143 [Cylindrobasidium torrendii FP15055 ss-10]
MLWRASPVSRLLWTRACFLVNYQQDKRPAKKSPRRRSCPPITMSSGTPNFAITGPIRPTGVPVNHPLHNLAMEYSQAYFSGQYFLSAHDIERFKTNTKFHLDMTYVMARRVWESEKDAEARRIARFTQFFYPLVEWAILRRSTVFVEGEYRLLSPDQVDIYASQPRPLPRPYSPPVDADAHPKSTGVGLSAEDLDLLDIGPGYTFPDKPPRLPRSKNEIPPPRVKKDLPPGAALFRKKASMSTSTRRDKQDAIKASSHSSALRLKAKPVALKIAIPPSAAAASSSNAMDTSSPSEALSSPLSSPVSISFSPSPLESSMPTYSSPPSSPMAVAHKQRISESDDEGMSDSDYPYGTDFSVLN